MDVLTSLIKKEKNQGDSTNQEKRKKFLTRRELETLQEQEHKDSKTTKKPKVEHNQDSSGATLIAKSAGNNDQSKASAGSHTTINKSLSKSEIRARFRALGQPIRLFGETDEQRLERLTVVESTENEDSGLALQGAYAMRNTFLESRDTSKAEHESIRKEALEGHHTSKVNKDKTEVAEEQTQKQTGAVVGSDKNGNSGSVTNSEEVKKPTSREKHIYRFIKKMLSEWEEQLALRPDEEKRKAQGKLATKTFQQCKDYIKPLLKKLKTKGLEESILFHLDKIVTFCEEREYIQAADWYVRLAIGNSPWPIGVTMVGIHERSGRERIESSRVAHIMNDEEQRKYITSMKRIMTFCQNKYPTEHSRMLL